MRLPYFSRSQQGVALLLGAALLLLWAWRANFWRAPSPPPARVLTPAFVEITGAVAHPGVYRFDQPPTLKEAWHRAGAAAAVPQEDRPLPSGTRLEVKPAGGYQLSRIPGPQLLTLGLPLDLNSATAQDLDALPGLGPALAQRIIDYRTSHGPFKQLDDLAAVSGIGPQNLAKLKPFLVLGPGEATAPPGREAAAAPGKPGSGTKLNPPAAAGSQPESRQRPGPKKPPARPLNPNLATPAELETLPGIGPVLAGRIIDYRRQHGPFKKIDDLTKVSGIGPKKLEKIKPYVSLKAPGPAAPDH
jgi:competence protein ComEA